MIQYAERTDLPTPLIKALQDPYYEIEMQAHWDQFPDNVRKKYKANHYSATTLPRAPRQHQLYLRHSHKVIADPLGAFWKLFGHMIHEILRKYSDKNDLVEKRLGKEIGGAYVHGQLDRYITDLLRLEDWKITKAETMLYDDRSEYIAQQNILAWLLRESGHDVQDIRLVYLFRNLDRRKFVEGQKYPKEEVLYSPLKLWEHKDCEHYIRQRLDDHEAAKRLDDDELPFCTDSERWVGDPIFRVIKQGNTKASHSTSVKLEAEDWLELHVKELKDKHVAREQKRIAKLKGDRGNKQVKPFTAPEFDITERKPSPVKCSYCDISQWCNQRQEELKQEENDDDTTTS